MYLLLQKARNIWYFAKAQKTNICVNADILFLENKIHLFHFLDHFGTFLAYLFLANRGGFGCKTCKKNRKKSLRDRPHWLTYKAILGGFSEKSHGYRITLCYRKSRVRSKRISQFHFRDDQERSLQESKPHQRSIKQFISDRQDVAL